MLGVCCHWIDDNGENLLKTNELRLSNWKNGSYSLEKVQSTYETNVKRHIDNVSKLIDSNVKLFRLTSSLFTLSDQVPRTCWDNEKISSLLKSLGQLFISAGIRVTTHPGQFCVLSSDSDEVVQKSIVELEHHAWIMDSMGLPSTQEFGINVHGGKAGRSEKLIEVINSLHPNIRNRLTLENDESSYSVVDLLKIYQKTGIPVVLDTHHHSFNDGNLPLKYAHDAACSTWLKGIKPLQHISNTEPGFENASFSNRRKHSNYIHTVPEIQLNALLKGQIAVEVEAKRKQLAVFKMSNDFGINIF